MSPKDSPQVPTIMATQQYCLKWNNHQGNLVKAFTRLLDQESFTDVTLACEGQSLRAHKVILSACSSYFEAIFEDHPDKSPIIILKDMKFDHVSQLVNFMYKGEINITQEVLNGLLKTAETLKVKGLAEVSNEQQPQATTFPATGYLNAVAAHPYLQQSFRIPASQIPQLIPSVTTNNTLNAALTTPINPTIPFTNLLRTEGTLVEEEGSKKSELSEDNEGRPRKILKLEPGRLSTSNGSMIQSPVQLSPATKAANHSKTPTQHSGHKSSKKSEHPTSPQPALTPIPSELTVNKQQELPEFLQGLQVFRLNDYLGFRTRQQFWEEPSVQRIMKGIKCKEIDMKSAAEILGVSYGTLYGRYREAFGYLKHAWVNKPTKSHMTISASSSKERDVWSEPKALDIIQKVLNKELSLTAAAVRLGVDYNTFFAHLTDNGKDDSRVDLLTGKCNSEDMDMDDSMMEENPYLNHVHATMHEGELDESQMNGDESHEDVNGEHKTVEEIESEEQEALQCEQSFKKEDDETMQELDESDGAFEEMVEEKLETSQ